jgi:hypothetical protein
MSLFLKIIFVLLLGIVIKAFWFDSTSEKMYLEETNSTELINDMPVTPIDSSVQAESSTGVTSHFTCDGRIHCSQMTSCEEAKFFLNNCPGTKMDGGNDGIPCESQWCNTQ